MDEKVAHKHACTSHPTHKVCRIRKYHVCECGVRASIELPDVWNLTATALLNMEAEAKEFHKNRKNDPLDKFIEEGFLSFIQELLKVTESPLDKCIRYINEIPQQCAVAAHYHGHHSSRKGLLHLCFAHYEGNEEKCAETIAQTMIALKLSEADLIHVGGGVPAYHSSHVEMDDTPLMGIHIDPIRRN